MFVSCNIFLVQHCLQIYYWFHKDWCYIRKQWNIGYWSPYGKFRSNRTFLQ